MSPLDRERLFAEAVTLHQRGRLAEVEPRYRQILAVFPEYAPALHLLGLLAYQVGKPAAALPLIQASLRLDPSEAPAWNNCGETLRALNRLPEAEACYREALARAPQEASFWSNLGIAFQDQERKGEAERAFRKAIELNPRFTKAWYNLGNTLRSLARLHEAEEALQTALRLQPEMPEAWNSLGAVRKQQHRLAEAEACYRRALTLRPKFVEALSNLAGCLKDSGQLTEAEFRYRECISHAPQFAEAHSGLGSVIREQGRGPEACAGYREALRISPSNLRYLANLIFTQAAHATGPDPSLLQAARTWGQAVLRAPLVSQPPKPSAGRRLKVGYLSSDFRQHAVASFISTLLASHDPAAVELFAYAHVGTPDSTTESIQRHVDHWHPIHALTDAEAARLIHSHGLDVLIDLNGHTRGSRLAVLGHRPAPVQAVYLGYFATSGLSTVDYWITDEVLHPPGSNEGWTESLWRLPRCWLAYGPPAAAPEPHSSPSPHFRFGSNHHLAKIGEPTLDLWSATLRAVPGSTLTLKTRHLGDAGTQERLVNALVSRGVSGERIRFAGHTPNFQDHLRSYHHYDLTLDPYPYTGGTTTCDALWMGVPVLTLAGNTMASRMSASMLTAVGDTRWITRSASEFVDRAVAYHQTWTGLSAEARQAERRERRASFAASPVADARDLARHLERAFAEMVDRAAATPASVP